MVDYPYAGILVADAVTFRRATNAAVTVYDVNDTNSTTPLVLKDLSGLPLPNPLTSTSDGFVRAFVTTAEGVKLVGGGLTVVEYSHVGIKDAAVAAAGAAQEAADSAATAAGNALSAAAVDGSGQLVVTKANGATVNAGNVKGPKGDKGDTGIPGSNVLPTDDAIEAAIKTAGTKTATALSATYVPKWKPNTAYLAGDAVLSPAGDTVTAKADFTSGASYSAANWNAAPAVAAKANASDVIPKWKATTAYTAGDKVVSPTGDIVSANASFTSGASYDATKWTLSPSYVAFGAASGNVVLGSNSFHTPSADTNTGFEVVKSITNPDKTFLGALSGYAVYFGAQQPATGSIQGGAGEAYSLMTGAITQAVLGWEGIGAAAGTGSYQQVIGLASTVLAKDTVSVQQLMGFQARGPVGDATTTVVNAYSIKALEPTTGTNRFTYHGIGTHAFVLGANSASDIVQIQGTAGVRRWGVGGGGVWTGYATDGTSTRMTLDPGDSPVSRISSDIYSGTGQHLTLKSGGTQVLGVEKTGEIRFYDTLKQTTVGPAGAAAALPSAPTAYFKVKTQAGTTLVIPAYLAA